MRSTTVSVVLAGAAAVAIAGSACASSPSEADLPPDAAPEIEGGRTFATDAAAEEQGEDAAPEPSDATSAADVADVADVAAGETCTHTPVGAECNPTSTICCELALCSRKGATNTRFCCRKPGKLCAEDSDCCGFESCDLQTRKCACQDVGMDCRGDHECCSGTCSGSATGTIGTCE